MWCNQISKSVRILKLCSLSLALGAVEFTMQRKISLQNILSLHPTYFLHLLKPFPCLHTDVSNSFNLPAHLHAHIEVFLLPEKSELFEILSFTKSSVSLELTVRDKKRNKISYRLLHERCWKCSLKISFHNFPIPLKKNTVNLTGFWLLFSVQTVFQLIMTATFHFNSLLMIKKNEPNTGTPFLLDYIFLIRKQTLF